jgi:C1A family cysteine protease
MNNLQEGSDIDKKRIYNLEIIKLDQSKITFVNLAKFTKTQKTPNVSIDLRTTNLWPAVYDQGILGSCTANAFCAVYAYLNNQFNKAKFSPSRLFLYYNARVLNQTASTDSGATIAQGVQSLLTNGVCMESLCPYVISNYKNKPSKEAYTNGLLHQALTYSHIPQDITQMKLCLSNQIPFVIGICVYTSFESKSASITGQIPIPNTKREQLLGGHAIVICGYNDITQQFIFRNSWGTSWGSVGYGLIPYAYLTNPYLTTDIWAITFVE